MPRVKQVTVLENFSVIERKKANVTAYLCLHCKKQIFASSSSRLKQHLLVCIPYQKLLSNDNDDNDVIVIEQNPINLETSNSSSSTNANTSSCSKLTTSQLKNTMQSPITLFAASTTPTRDLNAPCSSINSSLSASQPSEIPLCTTSISKECNNSMSSAKRPRLPNSSKLPQVIIIIIIIIIIRLYI